ncbi:acetyl-CoA C-acyltransferase [Alteribacter lacisalsi]|uniref:acetyl-CoA C-acetyltransferase n=1 Tax=Alteribacter lacisalsi TaxID=2045244 RepID=A0A2W0H5S6_9BACI|nr:acetyl-CoA C-acyltransferase [Alteribacter lacisalsi]PYZ95986.1 acetyl-CoA C-acyltransferase [Alteribacter lacisalsi]
MTTVILDGVRTPFGKWKGSLRDYEAKDLGALVVKELVTRVPEVKEADGVILAQVIQAGQGQNPARHVAAKGGVSLETPAVTLNNVCLGGLAAIADASRRITLGEGNLYIAGGFDSMTNAPYTSSIRKELAIGPVEYYDTLQDGLWCALSNESMGLLSDGKNEELTISREEQDAFAALSQQRASQAKAKLQEETFPIETKNGTLHHDEGIREGSTAEKLQKLSPAFRKDGTITAGNASQMSDGASVGIITSAEKADELGKKPLAAVLGWSEVAGPDESLHLKPARAIAALLEQQSLSVSDIDLFEINEAFASVAIASCRELDLPIEKVNVNGGAIAVGHPLAGTGFRLVLTLAHELRRRGGGKGIATLCGGGGQGMALLIDVPKEGGI